MMNNTYALQWITAACCRDCQRPAIFFQIIISQMTETENGKWEIHALFIFLIKMQKRCLSTAEVIGHSFLSASSPIWKKQLLTGNLLRAHPIPNSDTVSALKVRAQTVPLTMFTEDKQQSTAPIPCTPCAAGLDQGKCQKSSYWPPQMPRTTRGFPVWLCYFLFSLNITNKNFECIFIYVGKPEKAVCAPEGDQRTLSKSRSS